MQANKNYISSKGINYTRAKQGKRALATQKGVLNDLKLVAPKLFNAFYNAKIDLKEILKIISPNARIGRGIAQNFQMCLAKHLFRFFEDNFEIIKYGRLKLDVSDYTILFKKLNKKGLPMNIRTGSIDAISNQLSLNLFEDEGYEPILYFGYEVNKVGDFVNPRIVYIDEGVIQFTITEEHFSHATFNNNNSTNHQTKSEVTPKLKKKDTDDFDVV